MNSQTTCVLSLLSLDDHLDVCVVAFSTSAFVNPDSTPLMTTIVTTPPTKLLQKVSNCYSSQHNSAELTRASTISLLDDFGKLGRECNQSGNYSRSNSCLSIGSETSFEAGHFSTVSNHSEDFNAEDYNDFMFTGKSVDVLLGSYVPYSDVEELNGVSIKPLQITKK